MAKLATVCEPRGAIMLLVFPMIAVRIALWMVLPESRPILIDWSNRTTLLAMFVYGYVLAGEPGLMRVVDRQWKLMLGVALAFSAAMFAWAWPGTFLERLPVPFSISYALLWSVYTLGGLAWSVALLGAARSVPGGAHRWLDRASELLNPFYMLHQTVIVVFAFWLIGIRRGPIATYAVLFVGAFAATSVLCTLAKRWRVTRVVLGVRTVVPRDADDHRRTSSAQINAILP